MVRPDRRPTGRARLLPSRDFPGLRPPSPSDGEGLGERSSRDFASAFGYSAYFAVPPQPFIAASSLGVSPATAYRILPAAFAFCPHAPASLSQAARSA